MERPKMAPMLEQAISLGILTDGQARDADAFADGLATRVVSGELSIEQAGEQAIAAATCDGEAMRRSRARRGQPSPPAISLLAMFIALGAGESAPEPEPLRRRPPAPDDDPGPELAPGEVLYTVPYDPEAEGAHVRGRVVRAVLRAAEIARSYGWSAGMLRLHPAWHEQSLRAACIRQAVLWGVIR